MCGIIGLYNFDSQKQIVKSGLKIMQNRGSDDSSIFEKDKLIFGHNLHSIVNYVKQPIVSKTGAIVINCEIYNWKILNEKYALNAKNDAELVLLLIEHFGIDKINIALKEINGDYALAYYNFDKKIIVLARDNIGVKPLVYSFNKDKNSFAFSSEKKAFPFNTIHLNPRQILIFDTEKNIIKYLDNNISKEYTENTLENKDFVFGNLMVDSVIDRVPEKEFAVLLSGGVDSTVISKILSDVGRPFTGVIAYVEGNNEAKDLQFAKEVSKGLDINLLEAKVSIKEYEKELPKIIKLIESVDPIRVGVASTIYFATKKLSKTKPKVKVIFSGLGADELFAGYDRFKKSTNINKDCFSYLIKLYENDLYYQDIVTMYNKLELRVPFLDKRLVEFSLSLDSKYKINPDSGINKKILRDFAFSISVPKEIAYRSKKAAQYGSNFDKALEILAKKNGFDSKSEYLLSFNKEQNNIPIAALLSTGKDSLYAMNLMTKQGYNVKCLITIDSKNKDSFMFHTPTIKLSKLQSKAINLPLILVKTNGDKETELKDLKKAIISAKAKYKIEGIVTGALYSNYQRERIESICENVGIRAFSPLWQINQLNYLKDLIKNNYNVIITKIAAYGLNEKWLGRKIDNLAIQELETLQKKYGINPAGEGGEYESLVLDATFFNKKIEIKSKLKMENEFTGELEITSAKLVKK